MEGHRLLTPEASRSDVPASVNYETAGDLAAAQSAARAETFAG